MTAFLLGAFGAVLVIAPLCIGAIIGWKAHDKYTASLQPSAPEMRQPTEAELAQFKADQEAFEAMLHYSSERAYGLINDDLQELARKEQ